MENGIHYRTCHLCEAMCGVAIEMRDGHIASVRGDRDDPFSHGHICPKAVALKDIHNDPDRLTRPLQRTAEGWKELDWDCALDLVARRLHQVRTEHGRNAVGVYLGNPNVHNHGALVANLPFLRALGTQNRFSATSNDQLPHMLANLEMFGHQLLFPIPDIDHTELLICIGANPLASNGSLMSVPDLKGRLKALKARGGELVVIDPRRTETARQADAFHFIRPGSDALLLMAMVNVLFAENRVDLGAAQHWTRDLELVRLACLPYTPEAVAQQTGIEPVIIRDLAHRLATTQRAVLYGRIGTSTQSFGGLATWLIYLLNILTGKLDATGGLMFTQPAVDLVTLGALSGQRGHVGRRTSRVRGLPEFGGEYPASTMAEEMLTPGNGRIRAFVTIAGNPVLSSPGGQRLDEGLAQLDFMVSIDYYLNETTRHADIILPPTSALERSHYDVIFNMLSVRNVAKYSEPLFQPDDNARHDWQIMLELAHRLERLKRGGSLGLRRELGWRALKRIGPDGLLDLALRTGPYGQPVGRLQPLLQPAVDLIEAVLPERHPLKHLTGLSPLDRRWQDLPKGLSLAALRDQPHGLDLGPLRPSLPDRLYTRDRQVHLAPRRYLEDLPRLYQRLSEPVGGHLQLIGRRHLRSNNSWMHNSQRLVKGPERCTLMIHPRDASLAGLANGDQAEVTSEAGRIVLPVEITEDIMPGVVSVPHGWGHTRAGTTQRVAQAHAGASINDVIRDNQVDPVSGTSVLNGQAVTVTRHANEQRRRA
ncbi:molybdopterin-dependent oxidoreductase [Marinobacter sp. JSM 1782161]|uniref:molybdopterin-dependent oxidoreductase n=1 Tax=Marinobacter sp. JSM 1782161 TaxID=2685906 RepID=UPI001403727E|nr:molybdopterin-dependent oxidoreductase [Marinobacter sp. JSM 1782161]